MTRLGIWLVVAASGCGDSMGDGMTPMLDGASAGDGGAAEGSDLGGRPAVDLTGFVTTANGALFVDAQPFRLIGVNRYDVASFPPGSGKYACGNAYSDAQLDQLLSEIVSSTGATVLRTWAFQSFTAGGTDWSSLDRVVAGAKKHGLKLIFTLENEWRDCSEPDSSAADGRKSGAWYRDGYKKPTGAYPLAYRDYVQAVVRRYANEPTVALWQLLNEAESDDAQALLDFTRDVAALVKSLDGRHLVSLGTIGGGQAGTAGAAYRKLHALPQIDLVEAHDYHNESVALPGAPGSKENSVYADLADARALGKPFFVGEVGIAAPTPMYPFTVADRAKYMDAKLQATLGAGAVGVLVWSFYDLRADNHEGWDFNGADPLAAVLKRYAK
jgi:mannan endo-1,4-beta-mannosidase